MKADPGPFALRWLAVAAVAAVATVCLWHAGAGAGAGSRSVSLLGWDVRHPGPVQRKLQREMRTEIAKGGPASPADKSIVAGLVHQVDSLQATDRPGARGARGRSEQLAGTASKVEAVLKRKAQARRGTVALTEGGADDEAYWLLAKDKEGLPVLVIIFLVFGFVCMTVGAIFSLVMAVQYDGDADLRPMGPVYYYIIFFVASVSALVYYSMWSETGVMHVHDGDTERIVFPARYLDWAVTTPLMLVGLGLLGNAALPAILGMVGCDLIMIGCLYTAAIYAPVHKYFWFGVAVVFFLVLVFLMFQELSKADYGGRVSEYDADTLRWLTYILVFSWALFPIFWLVGQAGTSEAALDVEVAGIVLADMIAKIAFLLLLVFRLPAEGAAYYPSSRARETLRPSDDAFGGYGTGGTTSGPAGGQGYMTSSAYV
jgi:bacteriorhodopsin